MTKASTLVIGIGNPSRGDDAAGLEVATRLTQRGYAPVARCEGDLTVLMDLWRGQSDVCLVDMIRLAGSSPGAVHRFDLASQPLPYAVTCSSHALRQAQTVR